MLHIPLTPIMSVQETWSQGHPEALAQGAPRTTVAPSTPRLSQIFVVSPRGSTRGYDISLQAAGSVLSGAIHDDLRIPTHAQRLTFNGHPLRLDEGLASQGVRPGDTIYLSLRLRGGSYNPLSADTPSEDMETELADYDSEDTEASPARTHPSVETKQGEVWSSLRDKPWYVHAMAEDWFRLYVGPAMIGAEVHRVSLHTPSQCRALLSPQPPTLLPLIALLGEGAEGDIIGEWLITHCPPPTAIPPPHTAAFWSWVAKYCAAFSSREVKQRSPRTSQGPMDSYISCTSSTPRGNIYLSDEGGLGYGIRAGVDLPQDENIQGIWGDLYPLDEDTLHLLETLSTASRESVVLGEGSDLRLLLLGTLALMNGACEDHATVHPTCALSTTLDSRDSVSGLLPHEWRVGHAKWNTKATARLTIAYGTLYGVEEVGRPSIECMDCPATVSSRHGPSHSGWLAFMERNLEWSIFALAEDWVRLFVLKPLTGAQEDSITTHAMGATRRAMASLDAPWGVISVTFRDHPQSWRRREALCNSFMPALAAAVPLLAPHARPFWDFAVRWMDSLEWEGHSGPSCYPPIWTKESGLGLLSNAQCEQERVFPGLWGDHYGIRHSDRDQVGRLDNATSRSLVSFNPRDPSDQRVLLGPLSLLNHACLGHAQLVPDGSIGMQHSALRWRGAHSCLGIPLYYRQQMYICYSEDNKGMPKCPFCPADSYSPPPAPSSPTPSPVQLGTAARISSTPCSTGSLSQSTRNSSDQDSDSDFTSPDEEAPTLTPPATKSPRSRTANRKRRRRRIKAGRTEPTATERMYGDDVTRKIAKLLTLFRIAAVNVHLSTSFRTERLAMLMRAMYNNDVSVLAVAETQTLRTDLCPDKASKDIVEEGLTAGGQNIAYMMVNAYSPVKGSSTGFPGGSGVSLIWDARIPSERPYADHTSGRIAAITLVGPTGTRLRIIAVYGPTGPRERAKRLSVRRVRKLLDAQLTAASARGEQTMVLGDFNDVPLEDIEAFAPRADSYPKEHSCLDLLKNGTNDLSLRHIDM